MLNVNIRKQWLCRAELVLLVHKHPELNLKGLYVSAGSGMPTNSFLLCIHNAQVWSICQLSR